jgi:cytochrome oxidase Cu insertion factor (SCO1/SenC/PrrC family)
MVVLVMAIWGRELRVGLFAALRSWGGRVALGSLCAVVASAAGLVAWRVADARAAADVAADAGGTVVPLDGPAPPLRLTDQRGSPFDLARLQGRPALVLFAFAHCRTVCPLLVRDALAAQRAEGTGAAVVIVTLDPWRDTPSRLPHLARQWQLRRDAWVLSGSVTEVEATLDAWRIERSRSQVDGDVVHAARIFIVDREGRLAYATTGGGAPTLVRLLRSL